MAETKKMDVTPSDKVPAEATARPVIVGHGPLLKDPMVNAEKTDPKATATGKGKTVTPDEPTTAPVADAPKETPPETAPATAPEATEATETTEDAETTEEANNKDKEEGVPSDAAAVNAVAGQANSNPKAEEAKKQEEAAKRQAALDKLVEDKTYFVPIGRVSRRRNNRRAVIVLLLVVILALVGLDLVMDAGYLDLPVEAPTNFFQNN